MRDLGQEADGIIRPGQHTQTGTRDRDLVAKALPASNSPATNAWVAASLVPTDAATDPEQPHLVSVDIVELMARAAYVLPGR